MCFAVRRCAHLGATAHGRGSGAVRGWQHLHVALGPSAEELGKLCRQALAGSGSPWPRCRDGTRASGTGELCSSGHTERMMGSMPTWCPGQHPVPAPGRGMLPSYSPVSVQGLSAPSCLGTPKCPVEAEVNRALLHLPSHTLSFMWIFFYHE